ncbi:hypothetical protein CABS03_05230 [Colletotrichum abscissum]|uniref:Uncharacterized protein n=1 Tax=Colletotrichum abscissum TaxID=1671311 RepID=A0A9Q0BA84_9PEZI|nr:hypothetical protein CABS02_00463 [Colletotrichum abscissum]
MELCRHDQALLPWTQPTTSVHA